MYEFETLEAPSAFPGQFTMSRADNQVAATIAIGLAVTHSDHEKGISIDSIMTELKITWIRTPEWAANFAWPHRAVAEMVRNKLLETSPMVHRQLQDRQACVHMYCATTGQHNTFVNYGTF